LRRRRDRRLFRHGAVIDWRYQRNVGLPQWVGKPGRLDLVSRGAPALPKRIAALRFLQRFFAYGILCILALRHRVT
jgi:hypothetical protein